MKLKPEALERVVAIVFYGRSGSYFMQSLLDWHPNVISMPPYLPPGFYEFWAQYGHLPGRELIDGFVDYYPVLFDARSQCKSPVCGFDAGEVSGLTRMGPERNEHLGVDRTTFIRSLENIIGNEDRVSRKWFFQAIHVAYTEALGRQINPDPIIIFQLHTPAPSRALKLIEDFPDTLFLHVIRHPRQSLASHFAVYYKQGNLAEPTGVMSGIFFGGVPILPEYKQHSRAVRLEDLHNHPRETLQKVCEWLGLPWDDMLMKSTFDGKQWWNVRGSAQISGFSKVTISNKYRKYITPLDKFRLDVLLAPKYQAWNYVIPRWYLSTPVKLLTLPLLSIPFKMEFITVWASLKPNRQSMGIFAGRTVYTRKLLARAWRATFRAKQENELLPLI